jgi:hypothetical protein
MPVLAYTNANVEIHNLETAAIMCVFSAFVDVCGCV